MPYYLKEDPVLIQLNILIHCKFQGFSMSSKYTSIINHNLYYFNSLKNNVRASKINSSYPIKLRNLLWMPRGIWKISTQTFSEMVENPTKNTVEYSGLLLIKYRLEMEHNVA